MPTQEKELSRNELEIGQPSNVALANEKDNGKGQGTTLSLITLQKYLELFISREDLIRQVAL
jgi:hypothetical protein